MNALLLASVLLVSCVFAHAAETLYEGKPESHWIDALTNRNVGKAFARLGDKQERVLVRALMKQDGPNAGIIRTNAHGLLERQGNLLAILSLGATDPDPEVKKCAVDVVVGWLEHPNASARSKAATSLMECPEAWEAAYERLRKALNNVDPFINKAAAEALKAGPEDLETVLQTFYEESWQASNTEDGRSWEITIKAVDEAGAPIAGAEVWVCWRDKRDWESIDPADATARWAKFGRTGSDGLHKFSPLNWVPIATIHARKSGHVADVLKCNPPHTVEFGGPKAGNRTLPTMTVVLKRTQ